MTERKPVVDDKKRPALGRGLSALIPGAPAPGVQSKGLLTVPISEIEAEREQPRRYWNLKAIEELAQSIQARGILQPLLVRRAPQGGYRIIAGERRWRAAQQAGLREVPVIVKDISENDVFEVALIENIQREDLNPVEEAEAYHRLMTEHGLTQEQLSGRVGKERSTIANAIRLLKLPPLVREYLASGQLTAGHAKVLAGIGDHAELEDVARQAATKELSVRDVERLVERRKEKDAPADAKSRAHAPGRISALAKKLAKELDTPVEVKPKADGFELLVRFANLEDGENLLVAMLDMLAERPAKKHSREEKE